MMILMIVLVVVGVIVMKNHDDCAYSVSIFAIHVYNHILQKQI